MPTVHSVPVMPSCLVYSRASRVPPPGKARSFPCTLAVSIVALFSILVSAAAVSNVIVQRLAVIRMHCRFIRINVIDLGIVDIGDAALELLVLANLTVVILLQIFVCSLSAKYESLVVELRVVVQRMFQLVGDNGNSDNRNSMTLHSHEVHGD